MTDERDRAAAEVLDVLQRAVAATDESLAALGSIEQLQSRFEATIVALVEEAEIWSVATEAYAQAKDALNHARGCLEELQVQVAASHSSDVKSRAWAEQLVIWNEKLQSQLTVASQQASRFYELMRPMLIDIHLQHATRTPRWSESWPLDAEQAKRAWEQLRAGADSAQVESLDLQLAEFRWDVGWPQQRIASVVGLSQPAIAARLVRLELLLSFEVAAGHIRERASADGFRVVRWYPVVSRGPREPLSELVLESNKCIIQVDVMVASGDTGAQRRGALGRSISLDLFRLEAAAQRQRAGKRMVTGLAVYFRDRGTVGYFTTQEVARTVRLMGRLPTEAILQQLRETLVPARTLSELVERAEQPRIVPPSNTSTTGPTDTGSREE